MKLEVRFSSRFKTRTKENKNLNLLFSVIEKLANL